MIKKRQMACWFGWLFCALACTVQLHASATDIGIRSGVSSAPILSYFQQDGQNYRWLFWHAKTGQTGQFIATPSLPRHVFWHPDGSRVLYVLGNTIFHSRLGAATAQSDRIAELPTRFGEVKALWHERTTRKLRVATVQAVAETDIIRTNRGERYRLSDGTTVAGLAEPSWGLPFIVNVIELDADRRTWKLVGRRATKDEAGDTPGLAVVDEMRNEDGSSNQRLLESYTCRAGICRGDVPSDLLRQASQATQRLLEADDVSIWPDTRRTAALIFGTVMGDELHITAPIVSVTQDGRALTVVATEGRSQIGLGFDQSLVLIADEFSGDAPVVIDLQTGVQRMQAQGLQATWLPRANGKYR